MQWSCSCRARCSCGCGISRRWLSNCRHLSFQTAPYGFPCAHVSLKACLSSMLFIHRCVAPEDTGLVSACCRKPGCAYVHMWYIRTTVKLNSFVHVVPLWPYLLIDYVESGIHVHSETESVPCDVVAHACSCRVFTFLCATWTHLLEHHCENPGQALTSCMHHDS